MADIGIVYLIGAGPGDYGLLTIRAKECIEQAEVLVYDNLVNPAIIDRHCPAGCEKIFVGKMSANHTLKQEDINELLAAKALDHKIVVRLKGGDPYIFGRGGEEALHLVAKGVPFEVVNGISSAYAVPAYAGIPVTHRGIAASVAFITGHEDPTKEESDINWEKLATGVQTLVFLMGVKNLPLIVHELIKNGRQASTPIAVIRGGTYPTQKVVTGTLETIIEKVEQAKITPPSIIVVGEVVSLREKINWFETRPLFGKTIVVTRAREQASDLVAKLTSLGASVIEAPSIKIAPPDRDDIIRHIENIRDYDWIVFTSANGVDHFYTFLSAAGHDSRWLSGRKICAIGPATADALRGRGIVPDLVPEKYVSTRIIEKLSEENQIQGKSFLLPRADIAPPDLAQGLSAKGASKVEDVTVYRTIEENLDDRPAVKEVLSRGDYDIITFTSSSTARNFARVLQGLNVGISEGIQCAAIGPVTAETARGLGFTVGIESEEHTIDGLVKAILDHFTCGKSA